jgi:hypothetical protein
MNSRSGEQKERHPMIHKELRELIWGFFFISLGGLLLHIRLHPPAQSLFNWIPCAFGLVGTFVLPFLFNKRETVAYAYLFTWAAVIAGTVGMGYFSFTTWKGPITAVSVTVKSMIPDIIILWSKVFLAHKILRFHRPAGAVERWQKGCIE